MNERLNYRIDSKLKDEYNNFIEDKYGFKQNRCGSELSKWIKLGLAVNGHLEYQHDPGVQAMIQSIREDTLCTHTHPQKCANGTNKNSNENDEEWKEKMEKEIKELKEQLAEQSKPAKRVNTDMDMFVQLFKE